MYTQSLYLAFIALRKQIYRVKTMNGHDKYSRIESYKRDHKTYRIFCDEATEHIETMNLDYTIQEVFDSMLEKSQSKFGIKKYCY